MKNFKFKWLLLSFILSIASLNQVWGQNFKAAPMESKMQSSQIMSGGAYSGTVYEPFSNSTPSQGSPAMAPSGPRRGYDANGNWTPDAPDIETAADTGNSNESPIGEPWVMLLMALAFGGVIAIRQYKRKTVKSMNMKNSTSKFIATLALLLTIGTTNLWAWSQLYLVGDPCGSGDGRWSTKTYAMPEKGEDGQRVIYIYMTENDRFRFMIHYTWDEGKTYYDKPVGDGSIREMNGVSGTSQDLRFYMYADGTPEAAKYTGSTGIVSVNTYQKDHDNEPWIAIRRTAIKIRHKWSNSSWSDQDMTDNNDGTYTFTGNYGYNLTYIGSRDYDSNDEGSNFFKKFQDIATIYGSPSAGDACLFEYNANGYASIGSSTSYRGTLYIRKLSSITYNGNGKESGDVPSTQTNLPAGVAVNLAGAGTLGRSNYTLSGWNTAADGSGTHYDLGAEITPNGTNLTLYAEWKQEVDLLKGTNGTADGSSDVVIYLNATSLASHTNATRTGYDLTGYWTAASGGTKIVDANGSTFVKDVSGYTDSNCKWNRTGSISELIAQWSAHVYTMTLKPGLGGTGSDGSLTVAYDATAKTSMSYSFTNPGFHIIGWYPSQESDLKVLETDGTFAANNVSGYITSSKWSKTSNGDLYAHWAGNTFTVQFDANGGSGDAMADQNFTYNTAQNLRTNTYYKDGYSFDGWALTDDGDVVYANGADGCTITTTDGETVTLYAHWTQATITNLNFTPSSPAPEGDVAITPVFDHEPTGTTVICYELHSNSTATAEVPGTTFAEGGDSKVHFNAPSASGTYYVKATFRTGSSCSGGTTLNTIVVPIVISSDHTVTVRYMCDDVAIHAPSEYVVPAGGTLEITALTGDDVFGYTFDSWALGDGINQESVDGGTITISAFFNGVLTANYTKKNIIYFKNTLGWSEVYVNLLTGTWWDSDQGTGNNTLADDKSNKQMNLVPGTTDVYYYIYGNTATTKYVSFVDRSLKDYVGFEGTTENPVRVCYPTIPNPTNSQTEMDYFGFYSNTPMFVPSANYAGDLWNHSKAMYYSSGYWTKYTPGTGYYVRIYDPNNQATLLKRVEMVSENDLIPMTATTDLEANKTYFFEIEREGQEYYSNGDNTMTYANRYGRGTPWEFYRPSTYKKTKITTTAAGSYIFHMTHAGNQVEHNNSDVWRLRVAVEYPISNGDYRLIYKDDTHPNGKASAIVTNAAGSTDIVSFFVRNDQNPRLYIQKSTVADNGSITWAEYPTPGTPTNKITGDIASAITEYGVYNFNLVMDESGDMTVASVEPYEGNFYIRVDVANNKWDNYRDAAHVMAYSDFSISNSNSGEKYSHYWMKYCTGGENVKFVVANDYSPAISDTIIQQSPEVAHIDANGDNSALVSIRFSYNMKTNVAKRTYLAASSESSDFLVLQNSAAASSGNFTDANGTDKGGVDIKFSDKENFIYDITAKVKPNANVRVKVFAHYNETYQNFIGNHDVATFNDDSDSKLLLSGTGPDLQTIRILYDFKTNRLVSAWQASGTTTGELKIDADLMIVREHQEAADNIILAHDDLTDKDGKITTNKRIYAVMRFNRWILNNLDNPEDKEADHAKTEGDDQYTKYHQPLTPRYQLPTYERNLYYISFPFDVNVSDIFGFGTYGTHYAIQRYDGIGRAKNGYWVDSDPNWKWVPPTGKLNAYEGYVLSLSLSNMVVTNTNVWANNCSEVELYFPSAEEKFTIDTRNVTIAAINGEGSEYKCKINRGTPDGDRRIKDSYWRCIGVPSFANYNEELTSDGSSATINWQKDNASLPFIYNINWNDKSLTAYEGSTFPFKAMHSYLVQYGDAIHWSNVVVSSPASVVARQRNENTTEHTFCLKLMQGDTFGDQTFVRMTDKVGVTTGFDFDQDLWKQKFANRANIYTFIGYEQVAGNSMPMSEQKVVVPVGVQVAAEGEYTFAMPEGTGGTGVTLIDTETGVRTNLSALDYTVNLTAGTYDNRFVLEISPISNAPTGVENVQEDNVQNTTTRKVMIDGVLYIVKDGKIYDARGNRVE